MPKESFSPNDFQQMKCMIIVYDMKNILVYKEN